MCTEIKVPDIGDFSDVPIIDLYVKAGDSIAVDDALCTLESDKATMDIPATVAGVVKKVLVKIGDRVSEGSVLIHIEAETEAAAGANKPTGTAKEEKERPTAPTAHSVSTTRLPPGRPKEDGAPSGGSERSERGGTPADLECDMLVLGGGPGGYSTAFRAADLGLKTIIVERYSTLGGVCLNVGCIPSKALLHVAAVMEEAAHIEVCGVRFASPAVDLEKLRAHKEGVVKKLTTGLASMAKGRKVQHVQGVGRFLDPQHLEVTAADGKKLIVRFTQAIIAAGSSAVKLPFMPEDDRVIDSTGALALNFTPKRMLVIGGGIIGLEMATVYSTLGARITVVELGNSLMPGADRDLVKVWEKKNAHRFDRILLNTGVTAATVREAPTLASLAAQQGGVVSLGAAQRETEEGIEVTYSTGEKENFDLVLVAVGRSPNGKSIAAENTGVFVTERGFIPVDNQQRTNVSHIFAIGDIVGNPMLAHKAVHEGHVAAEVAAGLKSAFDALQIPSVAYTHPEIAWAGKTEEALKAEGRAFEKAVFPWAASGRAIANGAEEGFTKLLFDAETHRILGGAIVGTHAGDLIGEICLAIEMGANATDIGKTIHPHPTLCESVGMAAEIAEGSCTDIPAKSRNR